MQTLILVTGGIFWILTYLFIIIIDFKDKTYGMPLIALSANVSWEAIFSFILPHSPPQIFINYLWFGLDLIIVGQFLKFSKNEFLSHSNLNLYFIFFIVTITAFCVILFSSIKLNDLTGVYTAFSQNLLMSILFIFMFFKRNSLRGQSFYIALFKMFGTGLTSIYFYLNEPIPQNSFVLLSLFISIFFFDLLYTLLIVNKYKENRLLLFKI